MIHLSLWAFVMSTGNLIGFDIDLAKTVFENEGIDYQFQPIDWAMKETELKNGTIDVIWNGYSMTPERKKLVAFSQPYLENKQVLVSLDKNKIRSFSDMKGKKLGVQEGSSGESIVRENPQLLLDFVDNREPVAYNTFTDAFLDLKSGRIDGLVVAQAFADYYLSHDDSSQQYIITEREFPTEKQAVGVRLTDQTLLETINNGLKRAYENNQSQEISELWFGEDRILPPR